MRGSKEYCEQIEKYDLVSGIKVIVLYSIYILIICVQGILYGTDLSNVILSRLDLIVPVIILMIGMVFIKGDHQGFNSIGLTVRRLPISMAGGIGLAAILLISMFLYFSIYEQKSMSIQVPALYPSIFFLIGAVEEELVFRGYIQTRLAGAIKNEALCIFITAILFVFIHYPLRWVVANEISLQSLSMFHIVYLIALHLACSLVYKKTNCLYGAICLHYLYNLGQSIFVFA